MADDDNDIVNDANIEEVLGTDYTSNSHKAKGDIGGDGKVAPPKRVEKVVSAQVKAKKVGVGKKLKDMLFAADFKTVGNHVVADVVLPMWRDIMYESMAKGAETAIYGITGRRASINFKPGASSSFPYAGKVQYNNVTPINVNHRPAGQSARLPDQSSIRPAGRGMTDSVIFATRADAEAVLEGLINVIDQYEMVSLAEFKELCGMETSHMDVKFGWSLLRSVTIHQVRDGWVIDLPPLEQID